MSVFEAYQQRNVIDAFKGFTNEQIRDHLKRTAQPFAVCCAHFRGDYNLGIAIRNANAFGAREVFYIGKRHRDKRHEVGVHHYTTIHYLDDLEALKALQKHYVFVGVDNVPGAVPIRDYTWPVDALMIFGEEQDGLTPEIKSLCRDIVEIPMQGSVRSLNVGTASGIVMFDYATKAQQ